MIGMIFFTENPNRVGNPVRVPGKILLIDFVELKFLSKKGNFVVRPFRQDENEI
jgi:hypothetical protein